MIFFFLVRKEQRAEKKRMERCFVKTVSLEQCEFVEGINYSKLTNKLLNTLIFADMGSFAVADLESDSSLFQALRRSLGILSQAGFLPGSSGAGFFHCLLYRPGLEKKHSFIIYRRQPEMGRWGGNSQQCGVTTRSSLLVMLTGCKAVAHHFASKICCCQLERKGKL